MAQRLLCVIEGDGIGHEVIPAAVEVLHTVLPDVIIQPVEAGWEYFERTGLSMHPDTVEQVKQAGAVLVGTVTTPPYPVEGYISPALHLRRAVQAFANLRPTTSLPIPTSREGINLLIVRENTEDVYGGHEHTEDEGQTGISEKIITREATERVSRLAFEMAIRGGRKKVTIVHKANVLQQTDGLFRRVALEVASYYPEIITDEFFVDTAAYWMVKEPTRFDVILTPNLYGDILSDMAAAWGGGLGLAPSLSLGERVAIAEPAHGNVPAIAGLGIANPTAAILSVAMLLRYHWQMPEIAQHIVEAVRATLSEGDYTADVVMDGALSTSQFTESVCNHLH
ncbi:MAG: isocitrate/isopropylmalate dehydrogenase family protein [Anaerolineaceae bacterium]|nr:isocitrate/isopropylmalate dehydrogenase family protein [Anaerolineaceae bacterium]